MAFDSKISSVRIEKLNLDLECYMDLLEGRGIRLQSVESFDKKNEKVEDGLQSEFFGSDFGDDNAFAERYSCKCKKYIGKMYEGMYCEKCGTYVEYNDADLSKTGWIIIDHFSVVSPIYAAKLEDALGTSDGEKVFNKIIEVDYPDEDAPPMTEKDLNELKKHPYMHKGMTWLKNNLFEVLEYYRIRKPSKAKLFKELEDDIDNIWTSSIPVYTAILRTELPGVKGNKVFKMRINTIYQSIIRISNYINRFGEVEDMTPDNLITVDFQLAAIQKELDDLFNETYKELTSKKGIIVSKVLGGRMNFSARNIIVPSSGILRANEVELGYVTFMELYRYEIINFYSKIQDCTIAEASNAWKRALNHFNPIMYNIMCHMTTDEECKKYLTVMISRNPCINYGSSLCMHVVRVKEDLDDKTMTVPSTILKTMNADFDGDIENVYRIFGEDLTKKFSKCLDPRYNLYISRMDGRVNKDTLPFKDEIIGFTYFNMI